MSRENEVLASELAIDVDKDGNRDVIEMSTLTAMMCVAQLSEKGKKLMEDASDEILLEMLNTYSGIKIIY